MINNWFWIIIVWLLCGEPIIFRNNAAITSTEEVLCGALYATTIIIDQTSVDQQCISATKSNKITCPSLYDAFRSKKRFDSTCILLSNTSHSYHLNTSISLISTDYFEIVSENLSSTAIIDCQDGPYKISISNGNNIKLTGISFMNCPAESTSTSFLNFDASAYIKLTKLQFNGYNSGQNLLLRDCGNVEIVSLNGNGIRILFEKVIVGNIFRISDSTFSSGSYNTSSEDSNNATLFAGKGGGISIFLRNSVNDNNITIANCTFDNNSANFGAGLYLYMQRMTHDNTITLTGTNFTNNKATASGGALYIADFSSSEYSNQITITDSNFTKNYCNLNAGGSAIFSYNGYLKFHGENYIGGNTGTAMVLGATVVHIDGNLIFTKNYGMFGGAAFLYKCAMFNISSSSNITFQQNNATRDGGALFVFHLFQKKSCSCFFAPQNRSSFTGSINFTDNNASVYGHHIYSSTLRLCHTLSFQNAPKERIFFNPKISLNSVSTAADNFTLDPNQWANRSPGIYFHPQIQIYNEKGQNIKSQVQMQINHCYSSSGACHNATDDDNDNYSLFKNTYVVGPTNKINVALRGKPSDEYSVNFYVSSELGERTKNMKIKLANCPPMYVFDHDHEKCKCNASGYIAKCSTAGNQLYILPGCWISPSGNTYSCPVDNCVRCNHDKITSSFQKYCTYNFSHPCDKTRDQSSILCSKCLDNLSATIGGHQCVDCSKTKHYLWTPFLIALLATIILIVIAGSNYTSFASFFLPIALFYQLVTLVMTTTNNLGNFSTFLFTVFHGDDRFMYPFCFINGLDDLDLIWGRFFTALMWVVLYGALYLATSVFENRLNLKLAVLRSWPIVFVLYYIDIMKFSVSALRGMTIDDSFYLFNYAEEKYYGARHRPIFWCCILTLVLTGVMIVWFFWKVAHKRHRTMHDYVNNEAKTLDSVVSRRKIILLFVFYALYITLFIVIMEFFGGTNAFLMILSITFTGIFVYKQPYQSKLFNYYEALVYTDFLIIGVLSDNPDNEHSALDDTTSTFCEILIALPFVGCIICLLDTCFGTWKSNQQNLANTRNPLIPSRVLENL